MEDCCSFMEEPLTPQRLAVIMADDVSCASSNPVHSLFIEGLRDAYIAASDHEKRLMISSFSIAATPAMFVASFAASLASDKDISSYLVYAGVCAISLPIFRKFTECLQRTCCCRCENHKNVPELLAGCFASAPQEQELHWRFLRLSLPEELQNRIADFQ